jgi:hypothetical protein
MGIANITNNILTDSGAVIGAANGVATLDSGGKIPVAQLPNSVMEFKGTWSAATNTPTLADGTGNAGDVYEVSAAGTVNFGAGGIAFALGDYVVYDGATWQYSSGQKGTITSVALTVPSALSVSGSPITTSGTFAITGAGDATQYIDGSGSLQTFPVLASADKLILVVRNTSGATITKGTVVYINGANGNKPTIAKALATGDATSAQTLGIVQTNISNNSNGNVVLVGSVIDLDTSAFTEGQQLYLSGVTAGAYTATKTLAPTHLVYVGVIARAHPTQGVIEVKIQNGYELDEIHDVSITSVANNQGLFYDSASGLWKNKTIATVLGYTPADDAAVVKLTGNQTVAGVKTFTSALLANNPSGGATGEGLVVGQSFKIDGSGTSQRAVMYVVSNVLSNTYGSGLQIQGANLADDKGFGFNLNTTGGFEIYVKNTSYNKALTIANTNAATFTNTVTATSLIKTGGTAAQFLKADGSVDSNTYGTGTVTSVAALTLGTTGTDLSSTVATGTTTPVITLNVPTASATNRGALSAADWTTFNNKTSNTGTVTSVAALTIGTTGTDISSTVATGTTTPVITLNIPTASAANRGALSAADWTTFNNKASTAALANYLPLAGGTLTGALGITNANLNLSNAYSLTARNNANTAFISLIQRNTSDKVFIDADGYGTVLGGALSGTSASFSSSVTTGDNIVMSGGEFYYGPQSSSQKLRTYTSGTSGSATLNYSFWNGTAWGIKSTLDYNGAATFSSSVTAGVLSVIGSTSSLFSSSLTVKASGTNRGLSVQSSTAKTSTTSSPLLTLNSNETSTPQSLDFNYIGASSISNRYFSLQTSETAVAFGGNIVLQPNGGNVGIGTTAPADKLVVEGSDNYITSKSTSNIAGFKMINTSGTSLMVQVSNALVFDHLGTERMRITSGGDIDINGGAVRANGGYFRLATSGGVTTSGYFIRKASWIGTGIDHTPSIAGEGGYGINFYTNGSTSERMVITSGGNVLIGTGTDAGYKLQVNGQIAMDTGSYKGILGYTTSSWGGSAAFPTLYGSDVTKWIMHINPHISYTQNGVNGYAGAMNGATVRFASDTAAANFWDIGVGICSIGTDKFGIGRGGTIVFSIANTAAATFSSSVTATSFFESSDKTIKTLIEDNYQAKGIESITAKLYIKNGKEELGYFAQDVQGILPSAVSTGTDGLLSLSYREVHTAKIARLEKRVAELEQQLNLN